MTRVRLARVGDVEAVLRLERGVPTAPHWAEREYRGMVGKRAEGPVCRVLFVSEMDGSVVGFAVGRMVAGVAAELESVAVSRECHRSGIGRALCEAVVDWCREQGADEVELEVRAGSVGAIALYEGLGFSAVGVRRKYYEDPEEDAVLMRLDLGVSG